MQKQPELGAKSGDCAKKTEAKFNVMMIFDNSGSQNNTDPGFIRKEGALRFADDFYGYVKGNATAQVNMGVISFNTISEPGACGWVRLNDDATSSKIKTMINTATANPTGGTAYSPSLKDAAMMFETIINYSR